MSFGSRLEAFGTVPSGASVTATNAHAAGAATAVSLTAGLYTPTSYCTHLAARLNAVLTGGGVWTVTLSTGASGTGFVTINCTGVAWALTFTTAEAGTFIGFVGNLSSSATPRTGTQNARGLWLPKCPLMTEGRPSAAPRVTDLRSSEGPTGTMFALIGNTKYRHRMLSWSHVLEARTWASAAVAASLPLYCSWEEWFIDTQLGAGHTWFRPGSAFHVYWDNNGTDALVGSDLNSGSGPTAGWKLSGLNSIEPKRKDESWVAGYHTIEIPQIVTPG